MSLLLILVICLISIIAFETALFIWAYFRLRNDVADIGWGLGFTLTSATVLGCLGFGSMTTPQLALASLICAWTLRLSGYLGYRTRNSPEDARYKEMRIKWADKWAINSFIYVFLMQGFLLWLVSLNLQVSLYQLRSATDLTTTNWLGAGVAIFGLIYETIADLQKSAFKKNNSRNDVFIQSGLFKYSRYPQYFGEMTFWYGIFIFGFQFDWSAIGFACPLALNLLLRYFSGVPLLEKKYSQRPGYSDYAAKTPLFIPKISF